MIPISDLNEKDMEIILKEVKLLNNRELKDKLKAYGESEEFCTAPMTPITRPIFERKLAKLISGVSTGVVLENSDVSVSQNIDAALASGCSVAGCSDVQTETGLPVLKLEGNDTEKTNKPDADGDQSEDPITYYGVCCPVELPAEESCVFSDRLEVLKMVKKTKGARFKSFKTKEEAETFANATSEQLIQSPIRGIMDSPARPTTEFKISTVRFASESLPFKAPKIQDLVKLRKAIEANNVTTFKELVWGNPRYLISNGDTPTILQEGFRYNAMHTAAIKNKSEIARLLLDIIQDFSFIEKLYVEDEEVTRKSRITFLLDMYLNTPDKGLNETPLHFACKFGSIDVVKVLLTNPNTDRNVVNQYGEKPMDIVCARREDCLSLKEDILQLLDAQFYVPLVGYEDNSTQSIICEPWSPETPNNQSDISLDSLSGNSPLNSARILKACAGPMSPTQAQLFYQNWSAPPKGGKDCVRKTFHEIKRQDSDKGCERIGRELANVLKVPWEEYWYFLGCRVNIGSEKGLEKLEQYLLKKKHCFFAEMKQNNHCLDDVDASINCEDFTSTNEYLKPVTNITPEKNVTCPSTPVKGSIETPVKSPRGVDKQIDELTVAFQELAIISPTSKKVNKKPDEQMPKRVQHFGSGDMLDGVSKDDESATLGEVKSKESALSVSKKMELNESCGAGDSLRNISSTVPTSKFSWLEYMIPSISPAINRARRILGAIGIGSRLKDDKPYKAGSDEVDQDKPAEIKDKVNGARAKSTTAMKVVADICVFIEGAQPTKVDLDVLRAVETIDIPDSFPEIQKWQKHVISYSAQARISWPSPARLKRERNISSFSSQTLRIRKLSDKNLTDIQTDLYSKFASDSDKH